jgi:signal transduction histidine kinase/ActR/RegA family two-component response regulator
VGDIASGSDGWSVPLRAGSGTARPGPPEAGTAALDRELTQERVRGARTIGLLRLAGVSALFLLFLVLGGLLRRPAWTGNLALLAVYWILSLAVVCIGRRVDRLVPATILAVALLDMPMVFFLQLSTVADAPSPSGVAGFTVGVYVLLVIVSAFSLRGWYIVLTAATGAAFEILLQHLAGVGVGGMAWTLILLGLAGSACSCGCRRLVELARRVEAAEQERSVSALRRAERGASLGTLAAGVAHEINTPLTYVVTNLALMAERLGAPERADAAAPRASSADLAALEKGVRDVEGINARLVAAFKGRLSGELRHEFNNVQMLMMHAIGKTVTQVGRLAGRPASAQAAPPEQVHRLLLQAREGAERVRTIVRDLRTFARPGEEAPSPVDLSAALGSAINLTASEIHHRARLKTAFGPVPAVMASPGQLGQVFVNLLINAVQAIPEGAPQHNEIRVTTSTDGAGRALVEVGDTGAGIPPEHLGRLFDPFFTTKPLGRGTGLGLSICHRIVTALGGELSVESTPGRGSLFRVALPPACLPGVAEAADEPAPAATAATHARILVVDDDPGIGEIVRQALARDHDVIATTSGDEALSLLAEVGPFDVILCDLMMPIMTGMQLHAEVARRAPGQASRIVFITGGAFTPRAQAFLATTANPRLDKPFTPAELRGMVARVAAGSAAPAPLPVSPARAPRGRG